MLNRLTFGLALLATLTISAAAQAQVNWAQPDVGCVEELIPQAPSIPCLDLSAVPNASTDFPAGITPAERAMWVGERRLDLRMCRSLEIVRRETARPGSQGAGAMEIAWMRVQSLHATEGKIEALYAAANERKMPPQVLFGALMQESLLADLGIAEDGGNFSCGIAQLNIGEYCRWAEGAPESVRRESGWPVDEIAAWKAANPGKSACSALGNELVRPFYDVGRRRLGALPEYRLQASHLRDIPYADVARRFSPAPAATQRLRYSAVTAFNQACADYRYAIPAKARVLRDLYDDYVPAALKRRETYAAGDSFRRPCRHPVASRDYPVSTAWLLADGMYNAGPGVLSSVTWYNRIDRASIGKDSTWAGFHPPKLIESIYWAGQWDALTDKVVYQDMAGASRSNPWFRMCVDQRHLARVIQHATIPGHDFVSSLEPDGCRKSTYDPVTKELLVAGPAPERQRADGRRRP